MHILGPATPCILIGLPANLCVFTILLHCFQNLEWKGALETLKITDKYHTEKRSYRSCCLVTLNLYLDCLRLHKSPYLPVQTKPLPGFPLTPQSPHSSLRQTLIWIFTDSNNTLYPPVQTLSLTWIYTHSTIDLYLHVQTKLLPGFPITTQPPPFLPVHSKP